MTSIRPGKYSLKHPEDATPDPAIVTALKGVAKDGRVSCTTAHGLAAELAVTPAEIGKAMDLLEYRIIECQMGIFGYQPEKKILKAAETVSDELRDQLSGAVAKGKISCADCWRVAQTLDLQKIAVAAACEHLGLKVRPCQLGAF